MAHPLEQVAIVGIGNTEFSKNSGRSEMQLAAECVKAALDDAGLSPSDVDGMVTFTIDNNEDVALVRNLGVKELSYSSRIPHGGAGSGGSLVHAAGAIAAGLATTVVVWRAMNERSEYRFGQAVNGGAVAPGGGATAMEWAMPWGAMTPACWQAMFSHRYMTEYGVTNKDLAHLSVLMRKHAVNNPNAFGYQKPITIDDHQKSRWIIEPVLRLLDCCQESDGGQAFVLTSLERARDLAQRPVRIAAGAPLGYTQDDIRFTGHSIECRINAEHPETFVPSPGTIGLYHAPGGLGVRVDSGLYSGYTVPPHYDSMVAKLIVHGTNRNECLMRLRRALSEYVIDGIETSIPLHQKLMSEVDFINGDYDIHWLEKFVKINV